MPGKLGLSVILFNEEKPLGDFLTHIEGQVDEYAITIDQKTNDRTEEILKERGYKYEILPLNDSFSDLVNATISRLTTDWVICLAPDEKITKEDWEKIHNAIPMLEAKGIDAVYFPRKHWRDLAMTNEYIGHYPDHQLRLFRNNKIIKFVGRVHESPQYFKAPSISKDIHIQHFNVCAEYCSEERFLEKHHLYTRLSQIKD